MGMYDTVTWVDALEAPRCAAGHPLVSFQTKDRSWPSLDRLYIRLGKIYLLARSSGTEEIVERDDRLVLEQTTELTLATETESIVVTTTCTRCDPVLSWNREWGGSMRTEHPLQQFRLTVASGDVVSCTPIERETTSSLYEQHTRLGLRVVPIDSELYRELLEDARAAEG